MKRYRTAQTLSLGAGMIVQLSAAQAASRTGRIELVGPVEDGRYRLNEPLTFKKGEELGIEGDLPKVHQECVVCVNEPALDVVAKPAPAHRANKK